jgi:hypothetical protein
VNKFEGVFGRVSFGPADDILRRVARRVQYAAERGTPPAERDIAELQAHLPEQDPEPEWEPDYKTPHPEPEPAYYDEADRQRANLHAFVDVGVVQAWRAGDVLAYRAHQLLARHGRRGRVRLGLAGHGSVRRGTAGQGKGP